MAAVPQRAHAQGRAFVRQMRPEPQVWGLKIRGFQTLPVRAQGGGLWQHLPVSSGSLRNRQH